MPPKAGTKEFDAQFQRSCASPLQEKPSRPEIDGAAVLARFVNTGVDAGEMTGAEMYAAIATLKKSKGPKGDALEADLMKISRQKDKKIRLVEWCAEQAKDLAASNPELGVASLGASPRAAPAMPRLDLQGATAVPVRMGPPKEAGVGDLIGQSPRREMPARPATAGSMTARGDFASGAAAAAPPKADLPAPPMTARAGGPGAPPADMSASLATFLSGKDHLQMSGAEYHSLLAWLKTKGHPELEDKLMRVKLLGDKKYQLVKHIREHCAHLAPGAAQVGAQVMQLQHDQAGLAPPQMQMQSFPAAQTPVQQQVQVPMQQMQQMQMQQMQPQQQQQQWQQPQQTPLQTPVRQPAQPAPAQPAPAPAAAPPAAAAPTQAGAGSVAHGVQALEATIGRLEESFAFAVECMTTDLNAAKEQLRQLKALAQN